MSPAPATASASVASASPTCGVSVPVGERERALAELDRGVEVQLFGREEAEDGKRLEPPIERNVVRRLGERELDESPSFGDALREREVPGERRQAGGDVVVASSRA